jgi:ankyrin repeat protein
VRTGKKELVRALLAHGADSNAQIKKRPPSFLFTDLPERDWDLGATPFFMAAKAANAGLMRVLAAAGADSRLAVSSGTTPLMAAAGVGRAEGASPVSEKTVFEAVSAALELGSDVNAANKNGTTALHSAAAQGLDSVIEILVQSGAAVDVKDQLGRTPLSMAEGAKTETNTILLYRPETAERLRKLGARVGLLETEGIDPKGERR